MTNLLFYRCGLYTPTFAIGAGLGRLYGELICLAFPATGSPGAFAVVGAAALASGATHTVSTGVIILELTGQMNHMLPVLLAVLIARSVASNVSISIYDLLMSINGLPFLAAAELSELYNRVARDVMDRNPKFLTLKSTRKEAYALLVSTIGKASYDDIGIVDPEDDTLIGVVSRSGLSATIDKVTKYSRMAADLDKSASEKDESRLQRIQLACVGFFHDIKRIIVRTEYVCKFGCWK